MRRWSVGSLDSIVVVVISSVGFTAVSDVLLLRKTQVTPHLTLYQLTLNKSLRGRFLIGVSRGVTSFLEPQHPIVHHKLRLYPVYSILLKLDNWYELSLPTSIAKTAPGKANGLCNVARN